MRTKVLIDANRPGESLAGVIDRPAGVPRAWALFAHCFTCGKSLPAADTIATAFAAAGIAVLRFDFTGLGASEGEFAETNFSTNVEDFVRAARWLKEQEGSGPSLLIGHSLGGAAVLAAAASIPTARAVATIAAPAVPAHVLNLLSADHLQRIEADGETRVSLAGRAFSLRRQLIEDLCGHSLKTAVERLGKALLVLHSPFDATVGIDSASTLFGWAKHPKSFASLDDADHLLRKAFDARYAAAIIISWADRYLPASPPATPSGSVTIAGTVHDRLQQHVAAGHHHLLADEPRALGGDDSGPAPYDYLLAALGACTAMTIRMYADRKKLALDNVQVDLSHDGVGSAERMVRRITLTGDLSSGDRARLMEIAGKCPVHRTLSQPLVIETLEST